MILWWSRGHDDHMIIIQVQHPISYCRLSITSIGFFTSIMDKTLNLTATSKPCVVLVWYLIINSWSMPIRNQMFPLSRVLNSTGIFRCHSKVELTNDLKGAIVVALVEAPPWFHFNHSKNCGLPDYYIEPANIQSETAWNWYCWGNLWVLFSRQNWFHLNVFQAFFWPRKSENMVSP